jgi:hypothetical protein
MRMEPMFTAQPALISPASQGNEGDLEEKHNQSNPLSYFVCVI